MKIKAVTEMKNRKKMNDEGTSLVVQQSGGGSAGGTGSIPGLGSSHMLQNN